MKVTFYEMKTRLRPESSNEQKQNFKRHLHIGEQTWLFFDRLYFVKSYVVMMSRSCGLKEERNGPAETPEDEAQTTVRIQTDGHLSGRIQLTLQLHRATEGPNCIMGHLERRRQAGDHQRTKTGSEASAEQPLTLPAL